MANGTLNGRPAGPRASWIVTTIILVVIFLAAGAYFYLRPHRIRITVVQPQRQTVSNSITTNGKVEPIHGFEAHAPLSGTITKVLVAEGAQVKTGQLLVVLDDTRARSDLAAAQTRLKAAQEKYANLLAGGDPQQLLLRKTDLQKATADRNFAKRQFEALERLQQRGAATAEEVAAARDRLQRARADLAQLQTEVRYSPLEQAHAQSEINDSQINVQLAEEVLRDCNVRAPFDGTVYFVPVRTGAYVSTGDLLLQEADFSQLRVRAFVDEPEIGHLAVGQTVRITWDALPSHSWQGTVATLPSTVVSRGSRVVGEVFCTVDNSEHLLLPNIDVNTTIISNSKQNALTVPREAVHEDSSHNYVYVVQDGRLQRRDVKLGISNLTRVEILSGLSEKDVVAVQSLSPTPMAADVEVKIVENAS